MNRKTALITGAGQGIGRGIALALAKSGFNIIGVDVVYQPDNKEKGLFEVQERAREAGAEFLPMQADIANLADHQRVLQQAVAKFRRIDVLVNNAGVAPRQRLDVLETTTESYDRVMNINARGPFFLTQTIARQMIQQHEDQPEANHYIIFISSISAYYSSPTRAEYCLSKAAISHAARIFAHRLAEFGIRVFELR
ncbi:MAG: SDR family NAD(P)-dependent oxidoreductase, partial [candidate division KSB1 bacterium]|nr:SDR family NAD(P)-dependent oxidoreductase [candidate division KSB1 bacterium]